MNVIELNKHIVEEISDSDYQSPMLDLSPFPEVPVLELLKAEPRQSVADMVSNLLAA